MRSLILFLVFLIGAIGALKAQSPSPRIGCKDATILMQATELKQNLLQQGFVVVNDAMLSMDSREDFPVIARLQTGLYYQIVLIGNTRSKRMNLALYGPDKELVLRKEQQPGSSSNVISFSFSPSSSGDYTFLLSQTMKQELLAFKSKESVCGSFCILRLKQSDK
jgi:hypothetical protein